MRRACRPMSLLANRPTDFILVDIAGNSMAPHELPDLMDLVRAAQINIFQIDDVFQAVEKGRTARGDMSAYEPSRRHLTILG